MEGGLGVWIPNLDDFLSKPLSRRDSYQNPDPEDDANPVSRIVLDGIQSPSASFPANNMSPYCIPYV